MYVVEREIRAQFDALQQTVDYLTEKQAEITGFLAGAERLLYLGSGSSFCIAKSGAAQFSQRLGVPANAMAAGDLLVNFNAYRKSIAGATLVVLSRSGSTTELLEAIALCKAADPSTKVLSITTVLENPLTKVSDLNLVLPWANDVAICQTRTVSNLYLTSLMLAAFAEGSEATLTEARAILDVAKTYTEELEPHIKAISNQPWNHAVVLADSGMAGLAEEGALAFKEICRVNSNHYFILDSRHGPVVMVDENTFVAIALTNGNAALQDALVADIRKRTPHVLVMGSAGEASSQDGITRLPYPEGITQDDTRAIFFLWALQMVTFHHALWRGVDPDKPEGLNAWIAL